MPTGNPSLTTYETPIQPQIELPRTRGRGPWLSVLILALLAAIPATLWSQRERILSLLPRKQIQLALVAADTGEVRASMVENGSLESADTATVKCKVEALNGLIGGGPTGGGQGGGKSSGQSGSTSGASGTAGAAGSVSTVASSKSNSGASAKKQSTTKSTAVTTVTKAKVTTGPVAPPTALPATGASAATTATAASTSSDAVSVAAAAGSSPTLSSSKKAPTPPAIQSFTYTVTPYNPLRPATTTQVQTVQKAPEAQPQQGGRQQQESEKPGSTRILWILDEGTTVKKGQIVCELDAAAFRDQRDAQHIKVLEAENFVKQATNAFLVNDLELDRYRKGVLEQDKTALMNYIKLCEATLERSRLTYEWSRKAYDDALRPRAQMMADKLKRDRDQNALTEAKLQWERLVKHSGPKHSRELEAKRQAILVDKFALEQAYQLEKNKLDRLQRNIDSCKMAAPRDGIVVYANQTNMWGRTQVQIQDGTTVREGMPVFNVPDPSHMRVKATVNETKMAFIRTGMHVLVHVDAFPDHPLTGKVAEITPIPALGKGPMSDVKVYYAMIDLDNEFSELRPGMSTSIVFEIDKRSKATRIPVSSIRWVGAIPLVARPDGHGGYVWKTVRLGMMNAAFAEVVGGVEPGEQIVGDPALLPPPRNPPRPAKPAETVAQTRSTRQH